MPTKRINTKAHIQKKFCIAGPIIPSRHYFIAHRLDWDEIKSLIDDAEYFVLHAPRQSGKTTAIREIAKRIINEGEYAALVINVESAEAAGSKVEKALIAVVNLLAAALTEQLPEYTNVALRLREMTEQGKTVSLTFLLDTLLFICNSIDKPLVLFIDEIDSLAGESFLSVLRQIRTGFEFRPTNFPQSLCLIGLRDVRDYRIWSKDLGGYIPTSSPFNVKTISLRLSNFTQKEIQDLYDQHTDATGQKFTKEAIDCAFFLTQGQPWLANALAREACFKLMLDRTKPITREIIEQAKDILIVRRDTHIDSLIEKLNEPRVSLIMDAIISGEPVTQEYTSDDVQYCKDLGLLSSTATSFEIANPIYKQIIPAVLASKFQEAITRDIRSYVRKDGSLDMAKLLEEFTKFYRENSEAWLKSLPYKEAGPHIIMLAFMQRLINGKGQIIREYALGRRHVDLYIKWDKQTFVIELKIKHRESSRERGAEQLADYMDKTGAEGHLILFDRDPRRSWEEKISHEIIDIGTKKVHVWNM